MCAKTILNAIKKNKAVSPVSFDEDAFTTLEAHSKIYHADNLKISKQLTEIKDLLVAKNPSQDDSGS